MQNDSWAYEAPIGAVSFIPINLASRVTVGPVHNGAPKDAAIRYHSWSKRI